MKNKLWPYLPIFLLASLISNPAKADITYTFIKMICAPDLGTATIKVFYDENESGKTRAAQPEKDTYYLDAIGTTKPHQYGKKIVCNLGQGKTVAFATHIGSLPKNDDIVLFIDEAQNHRPLCGYTLGYGGLTLKVSAVATNEYLLTYCPDDPFLLGNAESGKCEMTHILKGAITGSKEIVEYDESGQTQ